jgi:hypothetical protein
MSLQPYCHTLLSALDARGFKYLDDVIHVFAGGSNQHGAKGEGSGDLDICGVYIEPAEIALGIDREEHFVSSTGNNERRNTSTDVDFSMYSLRKWANLAAKGKPDCTQLPVHAGNITSLDGLLQFRAIEVPC